MESSHLEILKVSVTTLEMTALLAIFTTASLILSEESLLTTPSLLILILVDTKVELNSPPTQTVTLANLLSH